MSPLPLQPASSSPFSHSTLPLHGRAHAFPVLQAIRVGAHLSRQKTYNVLCSLVDTLLIFLSVILLCDLLNTFENKIIKFYVKPASQNRKSFHFRHNHTVVNYKYLLPGSPLHTYDKSLHNI